MARPKAQVDAENELKSEASVSEKPESDTQTEMEKDIKAIMESVGTIAKEMKSLNEKWDKDMERVKTLAKAGRF